MDKSSSLENQIMQALLAGDDCILSVLREQYAQAFVKNRVFTGCGFFTEFQLAPDCPLTEPNNFELRDVSLEVEGTENGASAILFVRNGLIDTLEVVACTGDWPEKPRLIKIWYHSRKSLDNFNDLIVAEERDIAITRRDWTQ